METVQDISLNKIKLAKNSRMDIKDEELSGLMQSIKEVGLLQPIGVVKRKAGYEICYGNRRFLAASKLGLTSVPAVIHEHKTEADIDLMNLTENVQRRNISLTEVGRYIDLLKNQDLTYKEIAVRMGVNQTFVEQAAAAFKAIPKEFRADLDLKGAGSNRKKGRKGKITLGAARAIISATRRWHLSPKEAAFLYGSAKTDKRFNDINIPKYAAALKAGVKDPIGAAGTRTQMVVTFRMDEAEKEALYNTHVVKGPFKTLNAFFKAVLAGKKAARINIVK